MKGLDYSSGRPNLDAVVKAGYGFVARYAFASYPKGINKAEADDIRAHGLGLVLIYESYAGRAKEGRAAGGVDGLMALAQARAIGFPDSRPIYFAVDYNAPSSDQPAIDEYLKGAAAAIGIGRVGVYGSYAVVERCHARKTATWFWQTYAWSAGEVSTHAHFLQYKNGQTIGGATVDLNESKQADFGAWTKEVVVATPKPAINPPVVTKPNVAMQWALDNKIVDPDIIPNGAITWHSLIWTLYRARGKK